MSLCPQCDLPMVPEGACKLRCRGCGALLGCSEGA